jgi:carbon-monoxide dehydrogenase medium subunit
LIPGAFDYDRLSSLAEAIGLLARYGEECRVIAGGHSLIPMMKLRLVQPAHLVDLAGIGGLAGVGEEGAELVVGALITQHDLLASDLVRERCPLLYETAVPAPTPTRRRAASPTVARSRLPRRAS